MRRIAPYVVLVALAGCSSVEEPPSEAVPPDPIVVPEPIAAPDPIVEPDPIVPPDSIVEPDPIILPNPIVLPPPVAPIGFLVLGPLFADDGQFLGIVSYDEYGADSIANRYGTYGSIYGADSIWNEYGNYGGDYGALSAWNDYSSSPPCIYSDGVCSMFVTSNDFVSGPTIHPAVLAVELGRTDVLE